MSEKCDLATKETLSAVWTLNRLFIVATGQVPSPCYEVKVVRRPELIFPPRYAVMKCRPERIFCPRVITPYRAVGVFNSGPVEEITVYYEDGFEQVRVTIIEDPMLEASGHGDAAAATAAGDAAAQPAASGLGVAQGNAGGNGAPSLPPLRVGRFLETGRAEDIERLGAPQRVEATGYSTSYSFDEAFRDAVSNLPPDDNPFPDKLTTIHVVDIGAMIGGFPGFNQMYVTVEAFY